MNFLTRYPARTGMILLSIFVVLSVFFIYQYANKERARDMMDWQVRLSILADMRVASVEEWLNDRIDKLDELASNSTLQLYLSQYKIFNSNDVEMQAQLSHSKNLLRATSIRFGFPGYKNSAVNVDNDKHGSQGLGVLSDTGEILFSTTDFYRRIDQFKKQIETVMLTGDTGLIDIFKAGNKKLLYGYVKPVYPVQKLPEQKAIGAVIVLFEPEENLYKKLTNMHVSTKSDESILVRKSAENYEIISPIRSELAFFYKIPDSMIAAYEVSNSGLNLSIDYKNTEVLAVSRKINSSPWMLIQKIDAEEALQESDEHQKILISTFLLIALLLASMFIAVWRHSTSVRLLKISNELESRTALLDAVSDNINEHIFLLDENKRFIFANVSLVNSMKVDAEDIYGKKMSSVMGKEIAVKINALNCESDNKGCVLPLEFDGEENIFHVSTVNLQRGEYRNTRLFVLHDISAIKAEQEKRDRLAQGIISTLVKAVDLHDPYCVDHSSRTREVAMDIAHELGLEKSRCNALEMAALLANIGKLFVPKEILTKMDSLTEIESQQLRENINYAVDVLKELEFEGPVVKIISQKNESLDGSGYPKGLKSDDIMMEARILAISNAFVAMASSRAYRKGKPIKEVVNILLEQSDTHYDRHVIAALFHIAENKNDWDKWQNVTQ